jgi:hypothetical protein
MSDLDHEALEQDVAAVVLGAAEPEQYEAVVVHLRECPSCRELASRLRRALALVPLQVDDVQPPTRLRERILAAAAPGSSASHPAGVTAPRPRAKVRFQVAKARLPFSLRANAWAAYAAVLLVAGFAIGLAAGRIGAPGQVAPPATARYTLTGSGSMAGSSAQVVSLRGQGVSFVDFTGLPPLEASKVYEVWLIPANGRPVSAQVFRPDQDGTKVVLVASDLKGFKAIAVTVEPGPDGSPQPTQQPQLSGQVA